jgi:hypothetical protein
MPCFRARHFAFSMDGLRLSKFANLGGKGNILRQNLLRCFDWHVF